MDDCGSGSAPVIRYPGWNLCFTVHTGYKHTLSPKKHKDARMQWNLFPKMQNHLETMKPHLGDHLWPTGLSRSVLLLMFLCLQITLSYHVRPWRSRENKQQKFLHGSLHCTYSVAPNGLSQNFLSLVVNPVAFNTGKGGGGSSFHSECIPFNNNNRWVYARREDWVHI